MRFVRYACQLGLFAALLSVLPGAAASISCMANAEGQRRVDYSDFRTTWIPLPAAALEGAGEILGQVLPATGFQVQPAIRDGTRTTWRATRSDEQWRGASLEFVVDPGLGVAWANGVFPAKTSGVLEFDSVICAALQTAFPGTEALPKPRKRRDAGRGAALGETLDARFIKDLDWLYGKAVASGRALVVTPVLNVDAKYGGKGAADHPVELWQDLSSLTRWSRKGGGQPLLVGHRADSRNIGMPGVHHSFVVDNSRYLVFIVDPGTYELDGMSIELKRTTMPTTRPGDVQARSRVGSVLLEPGKYEDYYKQQEWQDAQYANRKVEHNYCASVFVMSGACAQWATSSQTVTDLVKQAGYETVTKAYAADVLRVDAQLDQPMASFTVAPGEAVVVDGFFAQHPSLSFDSNRCEAERRGVRCDLTEFLMVRIPGDVADLESADALQVTDSYPTLRSIFQKATYRKPKVSAKGDAFVPGLGQIHVVGIKR